MAGRETSQEKLALIADLDRARAGIGQESRQLAGALDAKQRLKLSIQESPAIWMGGMFAVGLVAALVIIPGSNSRDGEGESRNDESGDQAHKRSRKKKRSLFAPTATKGFILKTILKYARPSIETLARNKLDEMLTQRDEDPAGPGNPPKSPNNPLFKFFRKQS